jgi:hypothetical protein
MQKSKPLTNIKGEVREHAAADMKRFQHVKQALPGTLLKKLNVRGPQKKQPKSASRFACLPKWLSALAIVAMAGKRGLIWRLRIGSSRIRLRVCNAAMNKH